MHLQVAASVSEIGDPTGLVADLGLNMNSTRVFYGNFENYQLQLYKYAYLSNVFLKKRKVKVIKLTKWLPTFSKDAQK